ncbi:MAG: FtsW/RodA/SpoVE family cell cycle protein [Chloroflexi bacterium]|nr:FtsW/RodA/SpoVE family cell cycle protein [Chloroflexota bacterium]
MDISSKKHLFPFSTLFLGLYSLILSLSPALRARSWDVDYLYAHWLGFFTWLFLNWLAEKHLDAKIPDRDPYLFPLASLFSGWGLLTIWRLLPNFGLRQSLWLALSVTVMLLGLRWRKIFITLRRYKYILLSSGLLLTALTLIFGANPLDIEPRLWFNFGGIYLQPSELLKLLLVIYLSAYLADRVPIRNKFFPLIFPTLFLGGIALLLLVVQRDLGTASILVMLYASILYIATGRKRVLLGNAIILLAIGFFGYHFSQTIHTRLAIWLSPWDDPSGFGYQIIQSLMAIANGGLWGRGAGIGSPLFVPVAHSDFIFTAIAEETGLAGTLGLLTLFGIFLSRSMIIALRAPNRFQRILASGLTAYLGIQSLLIIGGNLRLLPLTGVTLPFISYGGSSLLTSYLALLLLLKISNESEGSTPPPFLWSTRPYHLLTAILLIGLITSALLNGWWAVVRGPDLLTRSDNPRRAQADFYVPRGNILDRNNAEINITTGESGNYLREYLYPELSSVVGYTNSVYGQAGIESSLDGYLRGLDGNPATLVWWNNLLYGQPPNGLNLRLSLDIGLQEDVDERLSKHKGAVVLVNAESGEILVMASHPTFDANEFDDSLLNEEDSPLLNRATQGRYPLHQTLDTLFDAPPVQIRLPFAESEEGFVSPLEMAMVAAALSNEGISPAPRLALAVDTSQSGWVILPALGETASLFSAADAEQLIATFSSDEEAYWQILSTQEDEENLTWLLAGTPANWSGTPLALAILLEENNPVLAEEIAQALLSSAP